MDFSRFDTAEYNRYVSDSYGNDQDRDEVEWTCPNCKAKNIDNKLHTMLPMCGACENTYDWCDIE